jgi:hypothetical protein
MKDERWKPLGDRPDYNFRTPYTELVGLRLKAPPPGEGPEPACGAPSGQKAEWGQLLAGSPLPSREGVRDSPLYVYIHFAEVYEVDPGRLMGSDEAQKPISEAEMTLIRYLRRVGVSPDEAIARLARPT